MLLEKQRSGAHYAVTQIFYDNELYFRFVKACRDQGVTIPIVPGLKILTRREQLNVVPKHFGATIPQRLVERIEASPPELVVDAGIEWGSSRRRSCSTAARRRCTSTSCRTRGRSWR